MCCERLWHADALKAMASLNRMVAVQYGQRQTSMHRAKFKLQEAKPERKVENFFHILKMDMRVTLWDPLVYRIVVVVKASNIENHSIHCSTLSEHIRKAFFSLFFLVFVVLFQNMTEKLRIQFLSTCCKHVPSSCSKQLFGPFCAS